MLLKEGARSVRMRTGRRASLSDLSGPARGSPRGLREPVHLTKLWNFSRHQTFRDFSPLDFSRFFWYQHFRKKNTTPAGGHPGRRRAAAGSAEKFPNFHRCPFMKTTLLPLIFLRFFRNLLPLRGRGGMGGNKQRAEKTWTDFKKWPALHPIT